VSLQENEAIEHYCREARIRKGDLVREAVLERVGIPRSAWDRDRDSEPPATPKAGPPPGSPPAAPPVAQRAAAGPQGPVYSTGDASPDANSLWVCPRCRAVLRAKRWTQSLREEHYNACPAIERAAAST